MFFFRRCAPQHPKFWYLQFFRPLSCKDAKNLRHAISHFNSWDYRFTLDYLISVGVCLSIFPRFSTQHALIPYHTFINPRPLLLMKKISIVFQSNFNIFCAFFGLKYRFDVIFKVNFPPNMIIPYPTFIFLPGNFHPIPLFHTVRLFDRLK